MLRNLVLVLALACLAPAVSAAVPAWVPVQGALKDNAGQPVLEGAFAMQVALYATADATVPLLEAAWPSDEGADCLVDATGCVIVKGGVFRIDLPVDPDVFADGEAWMGLSVEGEPELPRRRIGATPYAMHAGSASGLACDGCVAASALSDEALAQLSLGPDLLDDVSNGLLTNEFVDTFTYPGAIAIPDDYPPGFDAAIAVADVGIAKALTVHVALTNSDISTLSLTLMDPAGDLHVLYDGGDSGDSLDATWPSPDALVSGDLGSWIGQNPAGLWTLHIVDDGFLNNLQDGEVSELSISVDTLSSKKVEARADLVVTGGVQVGNTDAPCDAAHAGTLVFDASSKSLRVCDGTNWLRLRACDPACPAASTVECGDAVSSDCGDDCGVIGTATDALDCLTNVASTGCGSAVQDSCGNGCGLTGSAPDPAACPAVSDIACGQAIQDACGNSCTGIGTACGQGSCLSGACCGDGSSTGSEECDDGNQDDGDGCSSTCQDETPPTSTFDTFNYNGMTGWPLDLDAGGFCGSVTSQDQMDTLCVLAGFSAATGWVSEPKSINTCYCTCSINSWSSPCCSGQQTQTMITQVTCE